eukprot:322519_1
MAHQEEEKKAFTHITMEANSHFKLSKVNKHLLQSVHDKEIQAHLVNLMSASPDDSKSAVENTGHLQSLEQALLNVMVHRRTNASVKKVDIQDKMLKSPNTRTIADTLTIVPLLNFTAGVIPESVQTNLTKPASSADYVNALAQFSNIADICIDLSPEQNDLGIAATRLSTVWGNILTSSVGLSKDDPEALKKYKALEAMLWSSGSENPITGIKSARKKTELYDSETKAHSAYLAAMTSYINLEDDTSKIDPEKWAKLAPIEQQKVQMKFEDWISSGKNEVAQILSQMDNLLRGSTSQLISNARSLFANAKNTSVKLGDFYQVVFTPSDVFSADSTSWVHLETKKGADYSKIKSSSLKAGASAKASWGLWSVSGGGNHSKDTHSEDTETANASVDMKYCRVNLSRPWMNTGYMPSPDWYFGEFEAGKISQGSVSENSKDTNLTLSSYPVSFILAKDITITAHFSKAHMDQIATATSGGASVGWGPFKIGGSFSKSTFEKTATSQETNGKLTIEGPIIIAYVVETPPKSAPQKKK